MNDVVRALAQAVGSEGPREARGRAAVEIVRSARGYRWAAIYDVGDDEVALIADSGTTPPAHERVGIDKGLIGEAVRTRATRRRLGSRRADTRSRKRYRHRDARRGERPRRRVFLCGPRFFWRIAAALRPLYEISAGALQPRRRARPASTIGGTAGNTRWDRPRLPTSVRFALIDQLFDGSWSSEAQAGLSIVARRKGAPIGFATIEPKGLRFSWLDGLAGMPGVGIFGPFGVAPHRGQARARDGAAATRAQRVARRRVCASADSGGRR